MEVKDITIPDIGGAENVDVIEVFVSPGDEIAVDDSLLTLESEKASMEIPSPYSGKVQELKVHVGDKVSEGSLILTLQVTGESAVTETPVTKQQSNTQETKVTESTTTQAIKVPDIGGAEKVDVIDVMIKVGDSIAVDDSLITLESEKASMDIPAVIAGKVTELSIKVGDKISEGDTICMVEVASTEATPPAQKKSVDAPKQPEKNITPVPVKPVTSEVKQQTNTGAKSFVHASPSVRRIAREFGVDLDKVTGSGRKNRILKEDVQQYVKSALQQGPSASGLQLAPGPKVDFSKFGEIETQPLNKIKKLTGQNVHRSWVTVPHVTQFDEADITDLENFRQANKSDPQLNGAKLTPLVFIMKSVVKCLKKLPKFNSSLDANGENLIVKKYFHIGVAVDTPNGLVVPVVRDVDQKSLFELASELGVISTKARDKKLMPNDMQGGCFTISSLGGIGGTAFTPIINTPEVAILGVSRSKMQPVYLDNEFVPRLIMPFSLSYDHRVIDGADAARFTSLLAKCLSDIRQLLL